MSMESIRAPDLLASLRRIREVELGVSGSSQRMLDVVRGAMDASAALLFRPLAGAEEVRVGAPAPGEPMDTLEHRVSGPAGVTVIVVERSRARPFRDEDAMVLEILGSELVQRLDRQRIEAETNALRRQLELLRSLSSAGANPPGAADVANRAARALLEAFAGAHIVVHVLVQDHLELLAVRTVEGGDIADVPPWMERVSLERSTGLAVAVLDRVSVNRPAADVPPIRRRDLEERGLRHLTTMPLIVDDVVVGTLTVGHRTEAPWDEHSLKLLENTAAQLAVELAHARMLDAERRRADDLDAINELGTLVAQHLEPRAVLATAARELARLLDVARVHVLLSDEKREYLRGQSATEEGVSDVEIFLPAIHAVVYALGTRAPVVVVDAENDPRTNKAMVERVGAKSMAIVPLVAGGRVIGAIVLIETRRKRNFTENEMARVTAVANVVASAASNATTFEDLRRSYEALERAQAELVRHERLAALGELSASIAHEVRNPVAIIFNSLSELRRLERGRADARMLLDIVEEETTRLNRIVRDLLDFVRPYEAQPRKVELGAVVRGAVEAARRALPEPAIRIETQLSSGEREIAIDETMFQQALLNVIVNAVQASPPGATVEVRAEVVSALSGETLRCEVTDEGGGLDPDTSGRIFEPFFTTKATGTGLGLALVRRLMDGLGGTVVAESRPTAGALFRLTVPLKS